MYNALACLCIHGQLFNYECFVFKLVTYGNSREEARGQMIQALDAYVIKGTSNSLFPLLVGLYSLMFVIISSYSNLKMFSFTIWGL